MLKTAAQIIVFLLELAMLGALAYCGYRLGHGHWFRWILAGCCPALFVFLWGRWAAPKAPRKLKPPARLVFRLTLFFIAFAWLAVSGYPLTGISLFLLAFLAEWIGETSKA